MKSSRFCEETRFEVKPGMEAQLLAFWKQKIAPLARQAGGTHVTIYHNKASNTYVTSAHYESVEKASHFSSALQKVQPELMNLCRKAPSRETLQMIEELAA